MSLARALGLHVVALAALLPAPSRAAQSPAGQLTAVDCTGIEGWTSDPDVPLELTDAHLYFGGPAGDPAASAIAVHADTMLPAGCDPAQCAHGFRSELPMSLLDDQEHVVHAYGIDLSGDPNVELAGSPLVFSCPPPPIVGGEKRHVVSPEILTAWQFSTFFDLLIVDDALLTTLPDAPAIDVAPSLAMGDGADPTVWLLDQGFRRFVDPEHASAWRLDLATAVVMPAAQLAAMPEGTPLRPRPILLQGTMPAVYLLDDHQCVAGDPDPACDEGEGDGDGDTGSAQGDSSTGAISDGDTGDSGEASGSSEGDGTATADAGDTEPIATSDASAGARGGDAAGCGCNHAPPRSGLLLLAAAAALRRRRRR